jgi:hypothetical protein
MKVDQQGNLYLSGAGWLWVISPAGKHLGTIVGPIILTIWPGEMRTAKPYICARKPVFTEFDSIFLEFDPDRSA